MASPRKLPMMVWDHGKLLLFLTIIIGATALEALGRISSGDWQTITLAVCAYVMGNGRQALKGQLPIPTIGPRMTPDDNMTGEVSPSQPEPVAPPPEATTPSKAPQVPPSPTVSDWLDGLA